MGNTPGALQRPEGAACAHVTAALGLKRGKPFPLPPYKDQTLCGCWLFRDVGLERDAGDKSALSLPCHFISFVVVNR